jgi:thymidylate synthase (FAD)
LIDVTLKDYMGTDLSVVNAARVSFGKESEWNPDWRDDHYTDLLPKDAKLIKYLAKHRHMSPFGHCFATFHVKAPIFVARQLVKHKFLRWNEISRRYVDDEPEFYEPEEWRGRADDKKQGSSNLPVQVITKKFWDGDDETQEVKYDYTHMCLEEYKYLLDEGVCPEQARMVLPQSTMTEWWWSGSLDAWADMCNLRRKDDTQYETRLVANAISMDMKGLFPASWKALVL